MSVSINQYIFEGETKLRCSKCGLVHNLYFSGEYPEGVVQAIHDAMRLEGWGVSTITCPDCFDPQKENYLFEEDAGILDEYSDYDEDEFE